MLGKKLLFKVEVGPAVLSNSISDGSFRVRRVCYDENIISMFMLDGADVTPEKVNLCMDFFFFVVLMPI